MKLASLNGWQRLWVLLALLWMLVVAGFVTWSVGDAKPPLRDDWVSIASTSEAPSRTTAVV
jgi:hypothetical protein